MVSNVYPLLAHLSRSVQSVMYGWRTEHGALTPTPLPTNVPQAPDKLLKLKKCAYESELPYQSKRCGCKNANIACTHFCAWQGKLGSSFNENTKERLQFSSDDRVMRMKMIIYEVGESLRNSYDIQWQYIFFLLIVQYFSIDRTISVWK